jgi:hypothetical protein
MVLIKQRHLITIQPQGTPIRLDITPPYFFANYKAVRADHLGEDYKVRQSCQGSRIELGIVAFWLL